MATIAGREYVAPDDIKRVAQPVLAHRLVLTPDARVEQVEREPSSRACSTRSPSRPSTPRPVGIKRVAIHTCDDDGPGIPSNGTTPPQVTKA